MSNVSGVNTTNNNTSTENTSNKASALSSSDFYTLLTAEIKNQDPTEPVNNTDLVLQLTQLSAAQSTMEMNDNMTTYISNSALATATSMIGGTVTYTDSDSKTQTGVVSSVAKNNNTYDLVLSDGTSVAISDVRTVAPTTTTSTSTSTSSN